MTRKNHKYLHFSMENRKRLKLGKNATIVRYSSTFKYCIRRPEDSNYYQKLCEALLAHENDEKTLVDSVARWKMVV